MYKLIAIDLDNTLLNDDKEISRENIDLLNKLIDRGYEVVIATGRRYHSAKSLSQPINRPLTILANNGSIARHSWDDRLLFESPIAREDFISLVARGKARDLHPIIHVNSYEAGYDIIVEKDIRDQAYGNYFNNYEERYKRVDSYLDIEDEKVLALVYLGDKLTMKEFYLDIRETYNNKYSSHVAENIKAAEALLELMSPLGCKWQGLEKYARLRGIKEEEIISIGDDNNDISMIENAGLGIAMKNATEAVKNVADIVTEEDHNHSGPARELRRILL